MERVRAFDLRLILSITLITLVFCLAATDATAQGDPGANVNLIGLTPDPDDIPDRYFRQQNEPSCAVRPDDSACIICAYNDYRTLDVFGDAWQGVSQSCDAGNSWFSRIAPGHPAYTKAMPLPAAFAADPRLQAIPGMAILNFIAGYRDSNVGVLAIQHWLEVNREDADFYEPGKITYIADEGTSGRFIDKPDMVAVVDGSTPVKLFTEMENESLGTIERTFPGGKLYVAYAVFTGSNSVKVLVNTSDDWGQTWKNQATKLSEDQNQVSGISLTAIGDDVLAVWRRVGDNNNSDAIMYSVITNGGKKATKGAVLAQVCPFDQPTLAGDEPTAIPMVAFRTNDFPWSANDGNNFFVFYSDRERNPDGSCNFNGRPRIVTHYTQNNGRTWSDPVKVSDRPEYSGNDDSVNVNSFQFMPTAFGADGRIQVAWYDTRREADELGDLLLNQAVPYVADHPDLDPEITLNFVQRKVDVYTTSMTIDQVKTNDIPPAARVSQYSIEVECESNCGAIDEGDPVVVGYETEASFANKKLFGAGRLPFLGDYIALTARQFRKAGDAWISNATPSPEGDEDFFAAWTDNRDVRGNIADLGATLNYSQQGDAGLIANTTPDQTAVDSEETQSTTNTGLAAETGPPRDITKTAEGIDGVDLTIGLCEPAANPDDDLSRARDANIYGSVIKDRVRLVAPTPTKPLGGLQRAFAVTLANPGDIDETYLLKITQQPCTGTGCRASFRQQPSTPGTAVLEKDTVEKITVPADSTLARTVFIVGITTRAAKVQAFDSFTETENPDGTVVYATTGLPVSTVELGDSALLNPDICADGACDVGNSELHNLTLGNLTLGNLTLGNQSILALTLGNLTLGNLTLGNLTLGNLTLGNLTLGNLTLGNLTLGNLTLGNAALANPSLIEAGYEYGFTEETEYGELLEWAMSEDSGVDPALLNPALLAMTIDNPDELLNLTLGNLTLGNLTLGNLTLGNLTLGNLTLGNPAAPNLTLGNLTLGNLTLGNSAIADPVLNETTCPEGGPCEVSGLAYDDYTYPITNKGNVTTAIDADITVEGEVAATQLIAWTANVTPTSVNCENILVMEERVQAVVNNPDSSLDVADINAPFKGEISTVAGPGETVFFTLRVFGTPEQLKNVSVGGFTASSQAANCGPKYAVDENGDLVLDTNGDPIPVLDDESGEPVWECSDNLNDGIEQISIDRTPPTITLNGDNPMFVEFGFSYDEPGATAVDSVDGERPVTIIVEPAINTSVLATYEVVYTASDLSGNVASVSRFVTVQDTIPPSISQADRTEIVVATLDNTNTVCMSVDYSPNSSDSGSGIKSVTCTPVSPSFFAIGTHSVTCTAEDNAGNTADVTFNVTVLDGVLPTISQADITETVTAADPNPLRKTVSYTPTASDSGSGIKSVTCTPESGSFFTIGSHSVTCIAEDNAGNTADVTFNVTVRDGVLPTISQADITETVAATPEDPNPLGKTVSYTPTASDNDGIKSVTCTPASGSFFEIGTHSVTCTAEDNAGNKENVTFNVEVKVRYQWDIEVILAKRVAKAGSTIPVDWVYKDWDTGLPVDSSSLIGTISLRWEYLGSGGSCTGLATSGGEDSGESSFRYSASDMLWQYSWQTPVDPGKGEYRVTIMPPGGIVPEASACISLK